MSSLTAPGAVPGRGVDAGVADHYGSPLREQRALLAGRALVDLSHLDVIEVTGADRHSWLHNLSTQDLSSLGAGESTEAIFLQADGKIMSVAAVVDDGQTTFLIVDAGRGEELTAFLTSMKFMLRVDVAPSQMQAVGGYGADAPGGVVWRDPWPHLGPDTVSYFPGPDHPAEGHDRYIALLPPENHQAALAGRERAGLMAWNAQRIADRRPSARDIDEKSLPHEFDWLRTAVHLNKGCYRGQEAVARIVNLGRPPRRLVFLHVDGSEDRLPAVGADVTWEEKTVGTVRAAAMDMDLGPIALALVKRNVPEDAELEADGLPVRAEIIVRADGKTERAYERPKLKP